MWLYIPKTYCPSSPESLDLISQWGLFFQDRELFVTLSGKPTPRPYSWRGWKTRPWIKLLSGVTLQPSTAIRGVELWIQSLVDSPAKTSQLQESKLELKKAIAPGCSTSTADLFARLDQGTFLSRTCQDSLLTEPCQPYLKNFPKWGSMRSGECFLQKMWEAPILENESLSWPTPDAYNDPKSGGSAPWQKSYGTSGKQEHLHHTASSWPTATRQDFKRRGPNSKQQGLNEGAVNWPTPKAREPGRTTEGYGRGLAELVAGHKQTPQAKTWRTPSASDPVGGVKDLNSDKYSNAEAPKIKLRDQSASWPTPRANDFKGHCTNATTRKDGKCRNDQLVNAVIHTGPLAHQQQSNGNASSMNAQTSLPPKKRLNPTFVEWLMGVPTGWSLPIPIDQNDYKRWETESFRLLEQLH